MLNLGIRCWHCKLFFAWSLGVDNLDVGRSIARLLDHGSLSKPLPLVKDGDLNAIVQHMILAWGPNTAKVTKVKGHETETDVEQGGGGGQAWEH